jgi:23S rRNA pseudouridine2605 synthase
MAKKRLSKALAAAGIASRRKAEELIFAGKVTVNGEAVLLPQTLVDLTVDTVKVAGTTVAKEEAKVYYILNKPKNILCTAAPIKGKRVIDLFDKNDGRLFTAGRLDKDTTGLLIVTNDGHFANSIIHPSSGILKEYIAKVNVDVRHEHLVELSKGRFIEGSFVKPKKVEKVRRNTVKIVVGEGKKREVRELLARANLEAIELKRVRLGNLILGDLPEGSFRAMTEREKQLIFE